ncbi:DUF5702 domain-containing protein [Roseburia hominis]
MKKMVMGEITVFLSLVFLLLLGLVGAVLESASIQVLKNEKRADAGRATESIFAEYQRDLLEEYGIFGLEGSYETGDMSESNILNRLSLYGAENMEKDIERIKYLTDENGREFYRQAVQFERTRTGASVLDEFTGKLSVWKEQDQQAEEYGKENDRTSRELDHLLEQEESGLPAENNPLEQISDLKTGSLLGIVLPDGFSLSQKAVSKAQLVSHRALKKGYGVFEEKAGNTGDTIFFNLYLLDRFGNATAPKEERALDYELEYLLEGKESDKANLEAVAKKLCLFRMAANYGYLLTDAEKQAEAETLAGALCMLFVSPEIIPVVKQALLLAWAFGESVLDVRTLLDGKKVPLVKSRETWQLSLSALLKLGEEGALQDGRNAEGGYTYETYLQVLLFLEKKEVLTMRALDLVEQNLRVGKGFTWFQADQCVTAAGFEMTSSLRRGVKYHFKTEFMYQ